MFVGTFEHTLDGKGRLVLPRTFRAHLAERGFVTKLDGCLALWTPAEFETFARSMQEHARAGDLDPAALRTFAADAHEVRPDGQGRIVLPARLREHADLSETVVVNGRLNRVEIWDESRWQEVTVSADDSLAAAVAALGI